MKAKRARSPEDAPAGHMSDRVAIEQIVGQVVSQVLESHVPQLREELVRRVLEQLPAEAAVSANVTVENGASNLLKGVSAIHAGTTQKEILRALLDNTIRYCGRAAPGWRSFRYASRRRRKELLMLRSRKLQNLCLRRKRFRLILIPLPGMLQSMWLRLPSRNRLQLQKPNR